MMMLMFFHWQTSLLYDDMLMTRNDDDDDGVFNEMKQGMFNQEILCWQASPERISHPLSLSL